MASQLVRGHLAGGHPGERSDGGPVRSQEDAQKCNECPAGCLRRGRHRVNDRDREEADRRYGEADQQDRTASESPCEAEGSDSHSDADALNNDSVHEWFGGPCNLEEERAVCELQQSIKMPIG